MANSKPPTSGTSAPVLYAARCLGSPWHAAHGATSRTMYRPRSMIAEFFEAVTLGYRVASKRWVWRDATHTVPPVTTTSSTMPTVRSTLRIIRFVAGFRTSNEASTSLDGASDLLDGQPSGPLTQWPFVHGLAHGIRGEQAGRVQCRQRRVRVRDDERDLGATENHALGPCRPEIRNRADEQVGRLGGEDSPTELVEDRRVQSLAH